MPEPEFFILLIVTAVICAGCLAIAGLFFFFGRRRGSRALKIAALFSFGAGILAFAPMLLLLAAWVASALFGSSETPASTGAIGTFRGTGQGFVEIITIGPGPSYSFRHTVERDGVVACDESGRITIDGREIKFSPFTRCIDSKTARPLPTIEKFLSHSTYFFGAPPFDMLKPWPEDDYFLRKQPQ